MDAGNCLKQAVEYSVWLGVYRVIIEALRNLAAFSNIRWHEPIEL